MCVHIKARLPVTEQRPTPFSACARCMFSFADKCLWHFSSVYFGPFLALDASVGLSVALVQPEIAPYLWDGLEFRGDDHGGEILIVASCFS